MREPEIEPAAVDLELRADVLLGHRRAFDVPPRASRPPGRFPGRVLLRLLRLPEREVARILLQRVGLLGAHLLQLRAGQLPVLRVSSDPEVDVALGDIREVALEQRLDEVDDLGDRLAGLRLDVRPPEAEIVGVVDKPLRRLRGKPAAALAELRRLRIHLVVDVGDVVDERHLVAAAAKPAPQPHTENERPRVADMDALVDGRAADIHPHGPGGIRERIDPTGECVVEPDRHGAALPRSGAPPVWPLALGPGRVPSRQAGAPASRRRPPSTRERLRAARRPPPPPTAPARPAPRAGASAA